MVANLAFQGPRIGLTTPHRRGCYLEWQQQKATRAVYLDANPYQAWPDIP
jgi:hypothetical protein